MDRKLSLRRESLAELTTDELTSVVGAGTHILCATGLTYCDTCTVISEVSSVNAPCQTR